MCNGTVSRAHLTLSLIHSLDELWISRRRREQEDEAEAAPSASDLEEENSTEAAPLASDLDEKGSTEEEEEEIEGEWVKTRSPAKVEPKHEVETSACHVDLPQVGQEVAAAA